MFRKALRVHTFRVCLRTPTSEQPALPPPRNLLPRCLVSEPPPPPPPSQGITDTLKHLMDDGVGPSGALHFTLRCEKKLGTGKMHAFTLEVPPLQR